MITNNLNNNTILLAMKKCWISKKYINLDHNLKIEVYFSLKFILI